MHLKIENISHRYGATEVLQDISLDIPAGQIVCLVGPSGCGKSTLLRFIGGLERPDAGTVLQIGEPPAQSLNPLTFVFQHFALLPWRSVAGNISLVLEDHGMRGAEAKKIIADVLARTRLSDFAKADQDWLDDLLRGVSDGAPHLAAGAGRRFQNAVAARVAGIRRVASARVPPKMSPAPILLLSTARLASISSWKSECITSAPAPASSSCLAEARLLDRGVEEGTNGFSNSRPRYLLRRSTPHILRCQGVAVNDIAAA